MVLTAVLSPVYAQSPSPDPPAHLSDIGTVVQNIIKLLAPAAAIAFLVMILVGGYKFVMSSGDPKNIASARSTLIYAVIGVVLVVAAWLILKLIGTITGTNLTKFNLNF